MLFVANVVPHHTHHWTCKTAPLASGVQAARHASHVTGFVFVSFLTALPVIINRQWLDDDGKCMRRLWKEAELASLKLQGGSNTTGTICV
jgi:hypothetical protein